MRAGGGHCSILVGSRAAKHQKIEFSSFATEFQTPRRVSASSRARGEEILLVWSEGLSGLRQPGGSLHFVTISFQILGPRLAFQILEIRPVTIGLDSRRFRAPEIAHAWPIICFSAFESFRGSFQIDC